jgi:conjugative transfer region protein (TIGR03748 family)
MIRITFPGHCLALPTLCISTLLAGCTTPPSAHAPNTNITAQALTSQSSQPSTAITRTARYTLADTNPRADQIDPLNQVIDIRIPENLSPTVEEAIHYALLRSGYRLCAASDQLRQLYSYSLPGAHYQLGPITVRSALETIAGSAWQLRVDALKREVCFAAIANMDASKPRAVAAVAPDPASTEGASE